MDIAILVGLVVVPIAELSWTRRPTTVLLNLVVWLGLTGAAVQTLSLMGVEWNRVSLTWASLVGQICSLVTCRVGLSSSRENWKRLEVAGFGLVVLLVLVLTTRVVAIRPVGGGQSSGILVDLPHFMSGEDNAKWLNTFAQLTRNSPVEIGGVGGLFVIFATLAWNITRAFTRLLGVDWNQQSITLNAQFVLTVATSLISPMALIPHFGGVDRRKLIFTMPPVIAAAAFLVAFSFRIQNYGHLSEQLAIVVLVLSLSTMASKEANPAELLYSWMLVALGATLWLGLHFFVFVVILLAVVALARQRSTWDIRRPEAALASFGFGMAAVIAWQSYRYVNHSSGYLTALFAAPGGVESPTQLQWIIAIGALTLGHLWITDECPAVQQKLRTPVAAALLFYLALVMLNDLWRTDNINYGTKKLSYICVSVFLCSFLVPAASRILRSGPVHGKTLLSVMLSVGLVLLLTVDGGSSAAISQLKSGIWSGALTAQDHSFRDFARTNTAMPQDLDQTPIGCVAVGAEGRYVTTQETYLCTRFFISLAGEESGGQKIIEWQLNQSAEISKAQLSLVESRLRSRFLMVLDDKSFVIRQVSLDEVIAAAP